MTFLKWYSTIIFTLFLLSFFADMVSNNQLAELSISLIIWLPVAAYLWTKAFEVDPRFEYDTIVSDQNKEIDFLLRKIERLESKKNK
jgi:hypothetical protein